MNLILKPTTALSRAFYDLLRPDNIFNNDIFDIESNLSPVQLAVNVPSVNIIETPTEYILEVAAPGLQRKDFDIKVENNMLIVSAEREEEKEEGNDFNGFTQQEYSYDSFSRSFYLPENAKQAAIAAKYENGILKISVPKMKEALDKPAHKISVS